MEPALPRVETAATPVDEAFLVALGVRRLDVPVPFVEAGGPVNAYAIEDEGGTFSLFDTGVGTAVGVDAIDAHLRAQGLSLDRLSRVIVSHGHLDHYGNAERFAEASGAPVWMHPDDVEKTCGDGRWFKALEAHQSYYLSLGLSEAELGAMVEVSKRTFVEARQVRRARLHLLAEGQRLRFRHFEAEVLHLPGHTPGLVCLHAPAPRLLFSNDHLLQKVSPNPLLDFLGGEGAGKFRALSRYLESARRTRALELDAVLPGHGRCFAGHRAVLDGLFGFYAKRQAKVLARLDVSPATPFEVVAHIFPRWDALRLYLMLSEVLGALEVLEDAGAVRRVADGAVTRFERAG